MAMIKRVEDIGRQGRMVFKVVGRARGRYCECCRMRILMEGMGGREEKDWLVVACFACVAPMKRFFKNKCSTHL